MKKNFKRNKILLTSLIGLAVVASASVAFSTWIFGLNKDNASIDDIEVTVDGYKDTTKYIDIAVGTDKTIHLAEYSPIKSSTDNIASTEGITTETVKADFDISLSKFEFAYSADQFNFNNITFTMVVYKDTTEKNINEVAGTEVHSTAGTDTIVMRDAKSDDKKYEYLSLANATIEEKDLTEWFKPVENIGSFTYYEVLDTKKTLSLKWSDYFGNDSTDGAKASPATFYNTKYETYKDKTIREKLQFLNTADSEMKAMQEVFKETANIKIKITATLNVTEKTA